MSTRRPTRVSGKYASGIAFPVQADGGGLRLAEGDEYVRGLILSAVRPYYSDNPFEDQGGTLDPIFQNSATPEWRQSCKRRVRETFAELDRANLAKLISLDFSEGTDGDVHMHIRYINKESATESDVAVGLQGYQAIEPAPGFTG